MLLLAVDEASGRLRWRQDLGAPALRVGAKQGSSDMVSPQAQPFSGMLSRFVPLLVRRLPPLHFELSELDLVERRVVRRSPASRGLKLFRLIKADHRYYLAGRVGGDSLLVAVIDASSGQVTAAVRLPASVAEVRPTDFSPHRLWIHTEHSSWGVLDATTLGVVRLHGLQVKDGLAVVERLLGRGFLAPHASDHAAHALP